MKNFTMLMICALLITACQTSNDVAPSRSALSTAGLITALKLTSYRVASLPTPSTYTGDAMPIQETYLLKDDTHFSKTRTVDGTATTHSGTYSKTSIGGDNYYVLTYETDSHGSSCPLNPAGGASTEQLKITTTGAENFMSPYDGPDLTYTWIKNEVTTD